MLQERFCILYYLLNTGSGLNGIDDIKSHPFFASVDWKKLSSQK